MRTSFKKWFHLFTFGFSGSLLLPRLFSGCGKQGLLSSCSGQASHCGVFSCRGAEGSRAFRLLRLEFVSSEAVAPRLRALAPRPQCMASLFCSMWDRPGSGIEPVSPTLASEFLTTDPPGKPPNISHFHPGMYFSTMLGKGLCLRWNRKWALWLLNLFLTSDLIWNWIQLKNFKVWENQG